jgi:ABC-2 type transport system ATP-binding protein
MITLDQVVVSFSRGPFRTPFRALDGLSFEVQRGDFFGLLGPNGAGKSTAMYCLLGLIKPAAGLVRVMGAPPAPGAALFRGVAYLPEEPHYHAYLTVEEAVRYYATLSGGRPTDLRVTEVLEQVDLVEHRRLRVAKCSKGMKQKVGIAQCLIHRPELLLLDEPMRGLDPVTVHHFREILRELHRGGATILMNSHILSEVEQVATRVAILERGRVILQDSTERLARRHDDAYDVEVEAAAGFLAHEPVPVAPGAIWRGQVRAADLYSFMEHCRTTGSRVLSCSLRRTTLEEAFLAALRPEAAHA